MSDALTKLAEGERLLAVYEAACETPDAHETLRCVMALERWLGNNADALLAGMRALVEIASNEPLDIDERLRYLEVQVHREDWKAAQDAVERFTKEEA